MQNNIDLDFIAKQAYVDEISHVQTLIDYLKIDNYQWQAIQENAIKLANTIRTTKANGIENFIQQYSLTNSEGVAIMCLAESLLRIPDKPTATELIEDKLKNKNWRKHFNSKNSWFLNASTLGLLISGSIVDLGQSKSKISKLVNRFGEPVVLEGVKAAIKYMSDEFILGEDLKQAIKNSKSLQKQGYNFSFDILGESARTKKQADYYYDEYVKTISEIGKIAGKHNFNLSVKLTALHPKLLLRKHVRLTAELLPRLKHLCKLCLENNITLSFDAEESFRQDIYLKVLTELALDPDIADFKGLGFVIQGYSKRAFYIIDYIANLAKTSKRKFYVRLVKGAYWDSEIKHSQENGLEGYPVFTRKEFTDVSYIACAQKLFSYQNVIFPQFATHNAHTVAAIMELGNNMDYEFQRLQGMGVTLHDQILKMGKKSRIYAPIGKYEDLLAYLMRRLLENGANTSFVNIIGDKDIPISEIVANPVTLAQAHLTPNPKILLPAEIYLDRANSQGLELGIQTTYTTLSRDLLKYKNKIYAAHSLINGKRPDSIESEKRCLRPANHNEAIGILERVGAEGLQHALDNADKFFPIWAQVKTKLKAQALRNFGKLLEHNRNFICHVLINEAGKNIDDALNEIREAVDFANYYANMAEVMANPKSLPSYTGEESWLSWHARGVFVCISPWNFPLAIFCGQILAALVCGNTVIAKPADNTSIIATLAVELMLEAGIPHEAIQLVLTSGRTLSQVVLSDDRVKGVCFTGSNEVAININRTLAGRSTQAIASFIAETGGQNAMIVDSSALLEQASDAAVISAFGSIGQRCSALRVLYAQEEIFQPLVELIEGSMQELKIGDTNDLSVDLGPVIDDHAKNDLLAHIEAMEKDKKSKILATHFQQSELENLKASFFVPRLIKLHSLKQLERENFGPILHVIPFKSDHLPHVISEINATGYGLTFGLQTRIEEKIHSVARHIKAGNFYANRSMIGANVGTHPFGGENNSGTGFKAGGPHYLMRFMTERVKTINTAAIGGNIKLLQ
jgi:RHH-type proline utilization regulon transcriptional repressor/proline dehydrogenase/delta 1-pyrroline-5-carboxylate dehydrogenase